MYAVIDMGSNTVRLSVFRLEGNDIKPVFHKKSVAGLADYVNEAGNLSEKGILKAASVMEKFVKVLSGIQVNEIYAFATASLRNINNTEEALRRIREQSGIDLQVLSGEEEAVYGYIGATRCLHTEEGVVADIGGGSTELVFYKDGVIQQALSMPVGSLNMYLKYVKILVPTKSELQAVTRAVRAQLDKIDGVAAGYELICGVGGTIRAACKLNNEIFEAPPSNQTLEVENIEKIIETVRSNDKESLNHILKVAPERIHTIIPGMAILQTIAGYFHCKTVNVSKFGVREGYLYQKLICEGVIHGS